MLDTVPEWTSLVLDTSVLVPLLDPRPGEEKIPPALAGIIVNGVVRGIRTGRIPCVYVPEAVKLELAMILLVCRAYCRHCRIRLTLPDPQREANCPYCGQRLDKYDPRPVEMLEKVLDLAQRLIFKAYEEAFKRAGITVKERLSRRGEQIKYVPIDYYVHDIDLTSYVHTSKPAISQVLDLALELRKFHERIVELWQLPKSMFDYLIAASALHLALEGHVVCLISVGKDLARHVQVAKRYVKHVHNREVLLYHVDLRDLVLAGRP